MPAHTFKTGSTFAQDRQGTVAIIFGLMFLAFAMVAGMAIDYGRVTHMKTRLVAAADAASLAAGNALLDGRLDDSEIEALALRYFNSNMADGGGMFGTHTAPSINVNRPTGEVIIDVTATVPMSITKIAGFTEVNLPVNSATRFDQRDIELGIALDVTGSMRGQKLADLKVAAKDLIDILMPDSGQLNKVRIGLAPYAASVNAGSYANTVTGHSGGGHTCVHERGGAERFSDALPVGINKLGRRSSMNCPSATIQPLSDAKASLKTQIDGYTASGSTAGHLGAAWARYLVSPVWNSIWPSASQPTAYGDSSTIKAVILMTDGVFNTQYVGSNGNSSNQARSVCADMKTDNVAVYSIAFQAPGSAKTLLQECSSGSSFYFEASNGQELRQAFQKIAQKLNNLRLTN
ncbi:MAG: hypothetical protein K0U74_15965 [Alphaproteobacteria bacterium]|nr:hypothetical protein [Alphaproteobacteria bacterium]